MVDDNHRLLGRVGLRDLMRAPKQTSVGSVMRHGIASLKDDMSAEGAARELSSSGQSVLSVVDGDNRLVGIITHNDAFRQLEEEASEDMERFSAVTGETDHDYRDVPIWSDFLRRAPWIFGRQSPG